MSFTPPQGIQSPPRIPHVAINLAGADEFYEWEPPLVQWGFLLTDVVISCLAGGLTTASVGDALSEVYLVTMFNPAAGAQPVYWHGEQWFTHGGTIVASISGTATVGIRCFGYLMPDLDLVLGLT